MIHFQCPACGAPFEVDDRLAGRVGRCKACGGRTKVPSQGAAQAVATASPPRPRAMAAAAGPAPDAGCRGGRRASPALARGRPAAQLAGGGEQPGGPGADHHGRYAGPAAQARVRGRTVDPGPVQDGLRPVPPRPRVQQDAAGGGDHPRLSSRHGEGSRSSSAGSTRAPTSSRCRSSCACCWGWPPATTRSW